MTNLTKNVSGDTIVEVLIAIVIMALMLTGAYATSNDSLANIKDAEQRIEALGYAQSEVENLRAQAATQFATAPPYIKPLSAGGTAFCFALNNGNALKATPDPECIFDTIYTTQIQGLGETNLGLGVDTYGFEITVTWPSISPNASSLGPLQSTDQVTLYYRTSI